MATFGVSSQFLRHTYIGNHLEQCLVVCCAENWCPKCLVPANQWGTNVQFPNHNQTQTNQTLYAQATSQYPPEFITEGLRPIFSPFWAKLPYIYWHLPLHLLGYSPPTPLGCHQRPPQKIVWCTCRDDWLWCAILCNVCLPWTSPFQEWNINSQAIDSSWPQAAGTGVHWCPHWCNQETTHPLGSLQPGWFHLSRTVPLTYGWQPCSIAAHSGRFPLSEEHIHWTWVLGTLQHP